MKSILILMVFAVGLINAVDFSTHKTLDKEQPVIVDDEERIGDDANKVINTIPAVSIIFNIIPNQNE